MTDPLPTTLTCSDFESQGIKPKAGQCLLLLNSNQQELTCCGPELPDSGGGGNPLPDTGSDPSNGWTLPCPPDHPLLIG